jgi:hypothetical protein
MTTWYIPTSANICFGSGSASVRLEADGERVRGDQYKSGSFVGTEYAELAPLRASKHVEYVASYYPGGTRKFTGSGAHFVKWALLRGEAVDIDGNRDPKGEWKDRLPRPSRDVPLLRGYIDRVSSRVPATPPLSGGKTVHYHFYTDEGRWEEWKVESFGGPGYGSNGLTARGVVIRRYGRWFIAPPRIQEKAWRLYRAVNQAFR